MQFGKVKTLKLEDYQYHLPDERIAYHPLGQRDQSKLLVYKQGEITHRQFADLSSLLPAKSTLFFNNTQVIPARLIFEKESGAKIEIFLLEPLKPHQLYQLAITAASPCNWKCSIGNLKRWKDDNILQKEIAAGLVLSAKLINKEEGHVQFEWTEPNKTFAEVIELAGKVPLPPYIKREAMKEDEERYQTVYSKEKGAVAAPTAGLHFTPEVLQLLSEKGITQAYLTLHVSAGTFQPIKTNDVKAHQMHHEQVIISKECINALAQSDQKIIAVGTTAMRTLESLYWWAVKLEEDAQAAFNIEQDFAMQHQDVVLSRTKAAKLALAYMQAHNLNNIIGETSIFIFPGYRFRVCEGLITNFHQPGSSLILLVAAFVGDDWRKIYNAALNNNYRFLSYGDSSLLLP
ncbi:MAG TPA: S-adenosylmethionine:tRNA ribosyltransferase-isomerase [Cyclobacteriaceae bacterium]|nr:S-adenosylmethionine:tRNA ribosyltransferase-isomerase [Cyclobacteriaceae bacterium]